MCGALRRYVKPAEIAGQPCTSAVWIADAGKTVPVKTQFAPAPELAIEPMPVPPVMAFVEQPAAGSSIRAL